MTVEYKGPGFYNWGGEKVCSFDPASMKEFIEDAIEGYVSIKDAIDYQHLEEEAENPMFLREEEANKGDN